MTAAQKINQLNSFFLELFAFKNRATITGISNFLPSDLEIYEKSIQKYEAENPKYKGTLYILKAPMDPEQLGEDLFSLHSRTEQDLGSFCKILFETEKFAKKLKMSV